MKSFKAITLSGVAFLLLVGAVNAAGLPSGGDKTGANNSPSLAPMALNSLSNPPNKIANAAVEDEKGMLIGVVKNVETDTTGKPSKVNVSIMGSQKIIALDSSNLSYDEPNNVLIAALDESQIMQTPAATQD